MSSVFFEKVTLIGMMGCGKSTIGQCLARYWQVDFIDTDVIIAQRFNSSISDIFAGYGEECFRNVEHYVIDSQIKCNRAFIMAVGGGALLYNEKILFGNTKVIWLKASKKLIKSRIARCKNRPLLHRLDEEGFFTSREAIYKKAHIYIDVENKEIDQIVREIGSYW